MKSDTRNFCPKKHMVGHPPGTGLTQIREGNRRVKNWRIVAGLMGLLAIYALLGKLDTDIRLEEAERIAQLQPRIVLPTELVAEPAKPPVAVQRQASIGCARGGVL